LRRANNYRARWWVVPDDQNQPIEPYDTLYYQVGMAEGTYFYGYSFATLSALDPDGAPIATTATDILVEMVDSCTGVPLFMDFVDGNNVHSDNSAACQPILVTQPRLLLEPGLVNVQLSNKTGNTITCQILLHFAEPCRLVTEEVRRDVWGKHARFQAGIEARY